MLPRRSRVSARVSDSFSGGPQWKRQAVRHYEKLVAAAVKLCASPGLLFVASCTYSIGWERRSMCHRIHAIRAVRAIHAIHATHAIPMQPPCNPCGTHQCGHSGHLFRLSRPASGERELMGIAGRALTWAGREHRLMATGTQAGSVLEARCFMWLGPGPGCRPSRPLDVARVAVSPSSAAASLLSKKKDKKEGDEKRTSRGQRQQLPSLHRAACPFAAQGRSWRP